MCVICIKKTKALGKDDDDKHDTAGESPEDKTDVSHNGDSDTKYNEPSRTGFIFYTAEHIYYSLRMFSIYRCLYIECIVI